jgi:hypothetical protein
LETVDAIATSKNTAPKTMPKTAIADVWCITVLVLPNDSSSPTAGGGSGGAERKP